MQRLWVGGLDFNIGVDEVRDLFAQFGEVIGVTLPENREHPWQKNRGYGFVDFASAVEANRARVALSGESPFGRPLKVTEATGSPAGARFKMAARSQTGQT